MCREKLKIRRCKRCGVVLFFNSDIEDHASMTGHAEFEIIDVNDELQPET